MGLSFEIRICGAEGLLRPESSSAEYRYMGDGTGAPCGVFLQGTHEEDGPINWEILKFPRSDAVRGEPQPKLQRARVCGCTHVSAKKKQPRRGRSKARGTGAEIEELGKSEDRIKAMTPGKVDGDRLGRAKAVRVGTNCRRAT